MTLKIEAGKYYRTNDGRRVGPAIWDDESGGTPWPWKLVGDHCGWNWYSDSGMHFMHDVGLTIIAEWTEGQTLAELDVKPGDVVECVANPCDDLVGIRCVISEDGRAVADNAQCAPEYDELFNRKWRIISRASDLSETAVQPVGQSVDASNFTGKLRGIDSTATISDCLNALEQDDKPKTWGDWKSASGWEKDDDWLERIKPGHLEVMDTTGNKIVINRFTDLPKEDIVAFRIKPEPPEPKVDTVTVGIYASEDGFTTRPLLDEVKTHRITFQVTDGVPDCSSISMEKIDD